MVKSSTSAFLKVAVLIKDRVVYLIQLPLPRGGDDRPVTLDASVESEGGPGALPGLAHSTALGTVVLQTLPRAEVVVAPILQHGRPADPSDVRIARLVALVAVEEREGRIVDASCRVGLGQRGRLGLRRGRLGRGGRCVRGRLLGSRRRFQLVLPLVHRDHGLHDVQLELAVDPVSVPVCGHGHPVLLLPPLAPVVPVVGHVVLVHLGEYLVVALGYAPDGRRGDLLDGLLEVDRLLRCHGPLAPGAVSAALAAVVPQQLPVVLLSVASVLQHGRTAHVGDVRLARLGPLGTVVEREPRVVDATPFVEQGGGGVRRQRADVLLLGGSGPCPPVRGLVERHDLVARRRVLDGLVRFGDVIRLELGLLVVGRDREVARGAPVGERRETPCPGRARGLVPVPGDVHVELGAVRAQELLAVLVDVANLVGVGGAAEVAGVEAAEVEPADLLA
mmetsp:Transcript_36226/g.81453  ORF Transcript_36226/g.81453 Transcript_36226/m.81453 type:complete len:448 (-) Transcript_36226:1163-2506(-)